MQILGVTGSYEGTTPTGTLNISANDTYDVTNYASAVVNVPTTAPAYYIEKTKDANGKMIAGSYLMDFSTFTDVGDNMLYCAYKNSSVAGNINFSSLNSITGNNACFNMCYGCTGITGVDLSSLSILTGNAALEGAFFGCTGITGSINLSSLTSVGIAGNGNQLRSAFRGCTGITSVSFGNTSLQGLGCFQMSFYGCTGIIGTVDMSGIKGEQGNSYQDMFNGCININSFKAPSPTNYGFASSCFQRMFSGCSSLVDVDLYNITYCSSGSHNYVFSNMFENCSSLQNLSFISLTSGWASSAGIFSNCCKGCTSLTTLSFPALRNSGVSRTDVFNNMLSGVTGCTVHFPSNLQSVIGSWTAVTAGFGGTNTTVLFDLPESVVLNGNQYFRNPKYDTTTALSWSTYNRSQILYTSGLTTPQVGDVLYSDASCTIQFGTVTQVGN